METKYGGRAEEGREGTQRGFVEERKGGGLVCDSELCILNYGEVKDILTCVVLGALIRVLICIIIYDVCIFQDSNFLHIYFAWR